MAFTQSTSELMSMSIDDPLKIIIKDLDELYAAYMPFIRNGGILIPTTQNFKMGELLNVRLKIFGELAELSFLGKVIWKTPVKSENQKPCGIGIQFMKEDNGVTKASIEKHFANNLLTNKPTFTI